MILKGTEGKTMALITVAKMAAELGFRNLTPDIDAEEKRYQLRDIQMIMNYFEHVPDIEWCEDVRSTFKPEI